MTEKSKYLSVDFCTFHKMDLALFSLVFTLFWKSSTSIRCYQCVAELTYSTAESKCEQFDGSERFIVNCTNSSMCYKRVSELELGSGMTSKSFHRGCAAQTLNGDQRRINGTWQLVYDIHDVYDEGCKPDATDADRITKTAHCYCRGDLCNGSRSKFTHLNTVLFIITAWLAATCFDITSFS